jgi:Domain of unknown function (DUF4160)
VHVRRGSDEAKLWLRPDVVADDSSGFNASELNALVRIARQERERIERAWHGYFGHGG